MHITIVTCFQPLPLFTQLLGSWDLITFYGTQPELKVFQPLLHLTQPELKAFQPLPLYTWAELKGFQPFQLFTQPDPKAQVSLFDWNLSVVCCWGIINIKFFTFSSHFIAAEWISATLGTMHPCVYEGNISLYKFQDDKIYRTIEPISI